MNKLKLLVQYAKHNDIDIVLSDKYKVSACELDKRCIHISTKDIAKDVKQFGVYSFKTLLYNTIAHEIGHLLLDRHEYINLEEEIEAWRIASQILFMLDITIANKFIDFCLNGYEQLFSNNERV